MTVSYDDHTVKTLDALTHIRFRSGMYIGRLGDGSHPDDGIYIMMKEIIDNSVDEFVMNHGNRIQVNIEEEEGGGVSVRDFGRGIPLGKVVECVSQINTGAKYNGDVFHCSVGMNGVGTKAVNALSSHFLVRSYRGGEMVEACFSQGRLQRHTKQRTAEPDGTYVSFIPDRELFKNFSFRREFILKRLWHYAYLNTGLTLEWKELSFHSSHGLLDLLNAEVTDERLYDPMHYKGQHLEFACLHTSHYGESYFSFVNGQYTADGGTHLSAFREGFLKGVSEFAKRSFQGVDVREGLIGAFSLRLKDPLFESQTKNKLGNSEIRGPIVQEVKEAVIAWLHSHPDQARQLVDRVLFNEKLRRELATVRKEAREKHKKISFKIPKLRDCKYHRHDPQPYGEKSTLFLTEGDSASASIVAARDPLTQAVFSLRGKPLNVCGMKLDQLYKNEEMFNLMQALDVEEELSRLRYHKIVLATDADVDGMHIRNLLLTFFLTYFEGLVVNGHLFILETPLFKVCDREKTRYCYSEKERDRAIKQGKRGVEVTRFKGLGEISPHEFKQFIGEEMRLLPVTIHTLSEIRPTLQFYMGKNTPERKRFIMEHLVAVENG